MSSAATHSTSTDRPTQAAAASCSAERREPSLLRKECKKLLLGLIVFGILFTLPLGWLRFDPSINEALTLTKWYAQEHVLLCLVPAFFIAGAIAVFISQNAVMTYLGPTAPKPAAYGVASVSGAILAICSCTVLPPFAGIWRMAGPARSLPNMLVIRSVMGTQKTIVFVSLVIVMSTLTGWANGAFF